MNTIAPGVNLDTAARHLGSPAVVNAIRADLDATIKSLCWEIFCDLAGITEVTFQIVADEPHGGINTIYGVTIVSHDSDDEEAAEILYEHVAGHLNPLHRALLVTDIGLGYTTPGKTGTVTIHP